MSTLAHLDRRRFEVEVAYLLPWKDALVAPIKDGGGGSPLPRIVWLSRPKVAAAVAAPLSRGHFDLVHTHVPYPALGTRLVAAPGVPIVHTEHNL